MALLQRRILDTTEMKRKMEAEMETEYLQAYSSGRKTMSRGEHVGMKDRPREGKNPQNGG